MKARPRVLSYLLVASSLAILALYVLQPAQASILQEFPTPSPAAGPYYIIWEPSQGAAFFAENSLAKLVKAQQLPVGVVFTEYVIPNSVANIRGVAFDPGGRPPRRPNPSLWFTERDANKIGMLDLTTLALTEYSIPTLNSQPEQIVVDTTPNRYVWFTETNPGVSRIGRLNPDVTPVEITEFPTPTPNSLGPDARLAVDLTLSTRIWFTQPGVSQIAYLDSVTGSIFEFRIPTAGANPGGIASGNPAINSQVWFVERNANKLGVFTLTAAPTSGNFLEYVVPNPSPGLENIAVDSAGKVWFTERSNSANAFGSLIPSSGLFTEYRIPTANSGPFGITQGSANNVWVTETTASKIVLFTEINQSGATTMTATASTVSSVSTGTVATSSTVTSTVTTASFSTTTTSVVVSVSSFTTPLTVEITTTSTSTTSTTTTTTTTGTTPPITTAGLTTTTTTTQTVTPTTITTTTETTLTQTLPTSVTTETRRTTTTATRILGNIPGFPVESILAGLALGLAALTFTKRLGNRKGSNP